MTDETIDLPDAWQEPGHETMPSLLEEHPPDTLPADALLSEDKAPWPEPESEPATDYSQPHWQPMLAVFDLGIASQFDWAVTTGEIETYEHRETLRFLHIDSITGECLNQSCEVISSDSALHRAFQSRSQPPAPSYATSEPAEEFYRPALDRQFAGEQAESVEPQLHSFVRTSESSTTGETTDETTGDIFDAPRPRSTAVYRIVLENLQNLLQPAMPEALKTLLLRAKTSPSRKTQSPTLNPAPAELNFASFTRRHSAL